jgi:hypothetical protein
MDFIFMLTHGDRTVANCLDVVEEVIAAGVRHIGFKDVGVGEDVLVTLAERIRRAGAVSYMEVVSSTPETIDASIRMAVRTGAERVLGGQDTEAALEALSATGAAYYPFPGLPAGHPTVLHGDAGLVEADCARFRAAGCAGADLLAYRSAEADPLELIRAARRGLGDGWLIVAGSVDSPERIADIRTAGADAFTIGTAVFDNRFDAASGDIARQCVRILEYCELAA